MTITTKSGTKYLVRNGRIGRAPVASAYLPPDHPQNAHWEGRLFVNLTRPTVGECWTFSLGSMAITTTPIVAIER